MATREKQLSNYRQTLLDMRRRIVNSVGHVVDAINEDADNAANLSGVPLHNADVAQAGIIADVQVLDNESQLLASIDKALAQITAGTYGICDSCDKTIPSERLLALPFATRCAPCAANDEKALPNKPR